ncbi:hypothetical protein CMI37_29950 [Candidatus Pacearchaeota archaeon]|nr:hypothetical protein [Candidatus Pacearchaeota archaeon]|tara:strand:- start:1761 stop:2333 length:573 start_codon:yes stop_codon:yes gene_type:complete
MKNKITSVGIQRKTHFSGKRKIGMDTNIFIKFYDQPYLLGLEASRMFNYKNLLFTHAICLHEFSKYIKIKEKIDDREAKKKAKLFLRKRNVKVIYPKECFIPKDDIKLFEKESNKKLREGGKDYLKCHMPDSLILLAFKKWGINKVHSTDEIVRICAQFLGMDGAALPSFDKAITRALKGNTKYYKKKRH